MSYPSGCDQCGRRIKRDRQIDALKAQNAELLEALKAMLELDDYTTAQAAEVVRGEARAAIFKAKG